MGNVHLPIPEHEANITVYAQAKYYQRFVSVYIPNEPFRKLQDNLVAANIAQRGAIHKNPEKSDASEQARNAIAEANLERSIRRTKSKIKDLAFCNQFDLFATFTIASDRQNLDRSKQKLTSWVKNEKFRKGKFEYVIVPEFHKDMASLHFHALIKGYPGEVRLSYGTNGKPIKRRGRYYYSLPSFTSGFTNIKKIDNHITSIAKVGFYLQKYITKDMPLIFGNNRYWASHGLIRPVVEDNPESWYKTVEPDRSYETEYGKILEFDKGKHSLVDIFIEANQ